MFGHNLPGFYISIEGIRCCGKSTQTELLTQWLKEIYPGREILKTKEPGGTEKSDQIREAIVSKSKNGETLNPLAEMYLFAASRNQAIYELIKPALERGAIVVSDRCVLSSLCYQGFGLDLGWQNVLRVNTEVLEGITPNLIIFPDISTEESLKRIKLREVRDNVYDDKSPEYYEQVRKGYLFFLEKLPKEIIKIDGFLPAESQAELIREIMGKVFKEREIRSEIDFSNGRRK